MPEVREPLGRECANLIAHEALRKDSPNAQQADLVGVQHVGKEHLRPIVDALIEDIAEFGGDVEVAPKKASASPRQAKQFALIEPSTKIRVDVGINLAEVHPTDRLRVAKGMGTHRVGVLTSDDVDDELMAWLRQEYEQAALRH